MATITAEAKLYTGIRCWCVDKNISASLSSSFSVGNKNLPATDGSIISPGVLVFRVKRNVINLEVSRSLSLSSIGFATKGGGNNVITAGSPRVIDNTNNWKVKSSVVCKFPTYMRIDVEKLQLPEGTTCTVEFEEGWILEGDFPETTRAPSPKVSNFFTFRTPWYGLSFMNSSFSLPNRTGYRIKQLASSVNTASSIMARPVFNPGRLAAIELSTFNLSPTINYKAVSGSTMQATGTLGFIPLRIKQLASTVNSEFGFNLPFFDVVIVANANVSAEFITLPTGDRIRFLQNQNISADTALNSNTVDSRIRNIYSIANIVSTQSSITIKRTRPFTIQPINAAASMSVTANKIGIIYDLVNPNASGTPSQDWYGHSVAISENYFAVGAPQEDEATDLDTGRVYIYSLSSGTLSRTLLGNTYNSYGTPAQDDFGYAIDIEEPVIAVGSPYEDNGYTNNGRVNVINISDGSIVNTFQQPSTVATGEWRQGESVAISSDYVVVGSRVRVDVYNRNTGNLAFSLPINIGDFSTVAISGNNIIVGDATDNLAYIYSASTGTLVRTLTGPVANSDFGSAVAINGTYAVVGAQFVNVGGYTYVGRAYVYNISTGNLVNTLDYPNPTSDYLYFGRSIAMSDTHILIGGSHSTGNGHFTLFDINGTRINTWTNSVGLGDSVAIKGNYFIVGGIWKSQSGYSASGSAQVYSLNKP